MHNFAKNTHTPYTVLYCTLQVVVLHQIQRQCLEIHIILWLFCLLVFLYIPDIVNNVTKEYFVWMKINSAPYFIEEFFIQLICS